jgi:hypothetical protein
VTVASRLAPEVDALVTDRYLESLLAAYERRASDAPSDAELDPTVRLVAARLGADLIRVHPSFRFEERLAARLAEAGQRPAHAEMARGPEAAPIPLLDPARPESPAGRPRRPFLIGGTLASAALTIVGAAIVAWRLRRPAGPLSGIAATPPARDERVSLA